ncbi:MAG: LEA type 2 family protein [candidate division FCPU426 bacterium]
MGSWLKWAGAGLLILSGGCAHLGGLLEPPRVSVQSLRPVSITASHLEFVAKLAVANQLPLSLPLEQLAFAVQINGHAFANGVLANLPALGAGEEKTLDVPFAVGMKELLAVVGEITSRSPMRVDFQGRLNLGGQVPLPAVPFALGVDLPVPRLPRVSFAGFSLLKGNKAVGVSFKFENLNSFPLTLNALQAQVKLDQSAYSLVSLAEPVPMKAGQTSLVQLQLGDSWQKVAGLAAQLMMGKKLTPRFAGEAAADSEYGQLKIPLDLLGK